ncbi:MAG: hypothetical protein K8R54_07055 [Bacteroidales bacterium]|nr:hypothetical protein [Bacteroidales bacterium]
MGITLSELSYKAYVYLFDLRYFAKTVKDAGYEEKDIKNILNDAETLYKHLLNANTQKAEVDQYNILSEVFKLSDSILNDLKIMCCADKFINEKTDLIVETFAIKEKTEVIMNHILKKK